jgi:hypothetical protein
VKSLAKAKRAGEQALDLLKELQRRKNAKKYLEFVPYPVLRSNSDPTLIFMRGKPHGNWPNLTNGILHYCRNMGYLHLGLDAASLAIIQKLVPGTMVRITGPFPNGASQVFACYPSAQSLYFAGDWTGLEYLNFTPAATAITLEFFPNNNGIVGRNIYRSNTGEWLLVDTIPINKRTYQDVTPDTKLGVAMTGAFSSGSGQTVLATPPPRNLRQLTPHLNALHGISAGEVRWTPPARPDAWPAGYSFPPDSPPVALASFDNALTVLCKNRIFRLDGVPDAYSPSPTLAEDGCLAAGSVQVTPFGMIFLAPRGICLFDGQRSRCLTEGRLELWHLFPRWQVNRDQTTRANFGFYDHDRNGVQVNHIMDSLKGAGASWLAAFEDATLLNACSQDDLFSGRQSLDSQDWYSLGSAFHRGRYYLFVRSWQTGEGCGCWVMDFNLPGYRLTHIGLQPMDAYVDGNDFLLLLNGDQ